MERLSLNPYTIKRLKPFDKAPFTVADSVISKLTSLPLTFEVLILSGDLFIADHSYQAKYPTIAGRYGAACTALFFIHPIVSTRDAYP
jgi:hypothetical protein